MASLRDIKKNISSIKSIKQITYAMKMVAAARIKRAQGAILASRPFALKMETLIEDLYSELGEADLAGTPAHELFEERAEGGTLCLVLVTADKGLCGSFNTNLLKAAAAWLKENRGRKIRVVTVGRKGRDFLHRLKGLDLEIIHEMVGIFPKAGYVHAQLLVDELLKLYSDKNVESVTLIYNEFKSMMTQQIVTGRLLPLKRSVLEKKTCSTGQCGVFSFEPRKAELLSALLPRHIGAQLYRTLLESQAAELAARMNAMESASKNATELIEGLTLKMNKTRQAMITTELNEIVSGAEALGG
ncbi:MAG: ATP synthase F1 subunit gamma [Elusimicrobia bacterium CG_4_10_14_0_2_um_filter_56_8]|nr:MAG: ATP synthase F1 subunit gamma [Elusimicrobia bacterium CG1_02_56_21]PJA15173.1 MAG: ATP synthase F1 subunit gamma [Elusimicrobia bacterium CG_4_10_14_0_2_um_filter_56_8]